MFRRSSTVEHLNDRIDQEAVNAQRERWEIALATWKTQSALARELMEPTPRLRPAPPVAAQKADPILFDAMAERLNFLERKATRLESDLRTWERKHRTQGRLLLIVGGIALVLLLAGLVAGLLAFKAGRSPRASDVILELERLPSASRTR
jgi:hypothetical protein